MSFSLISAASAAATPAAAPGAPAGALGLLGSPVIFFAVMIGIMYFMMIRPQMKRQKEMRAMLGQLAKGDEVIAAGIAGRVEDVGDSFVSVEIAPNVKIRVQKGAITQVLPKGTLKSS